MAAKEHKTFIRRCVLGAIGGILMAAGDWLLGCIPIQAADTGMFDRAYYLSGSYGLWRPVLIVGLGAIGAFLYFFMVKALNADIGAQYGKTKSVQYLCGIFTAAVALAIHLWSATLAWFTAYPWPSDRRRSRSRGSHGLSGRYAHRNSADVCSNGTDDRDPFCDAASRKDPLSQADARVSSGHMERSARRHSGYRTGHADTRRHMDVRHEPEQRKQRDRALVHRGSDL